MKLLAMLILFYLAVRFLLISWLPFISDENIYAMMIEEQAKNPTLMPTFLGFEVGWKPPIFFWVYAAFTRILIHLPIALEAVYRLPTVFFGLVNLVLVFQIIRRISDIKLAFFTTLIYSLTFLVIYTDGMVLTDTLAMTFVFASILVYLYALERNALFIAAGFLVFLAFFTKWIIALIAPFFIAIYMLQFHRKKLQEPLFILSLLFIPAAFLLNSMISDQASSVYSDIIMNKIVNNVNLLSFQQSMVPFISLTSVWIPLSLFGFARHWRKNLAMSAWYSLAVFSIMAGAGMPFYHLPVMVPMAYFSALILLMDARDRITTDRFFYVILVLMALAGLIIGSFVYADLTDRVMAQKEAGEFLVSKENVAVIGWYAPGIVAYKVLEENRQHGKWLDFGWIIAHSAPGSTVEPFVRDYHASVKGVSDGSFSEMFFQPKIFRKETNISHFNYVVLAGNFTTNVDGVVLYNRSNIIILGK